MQQLPFRLSLVAILAAAQASAQQPRILGKVTDRNGKPVVDAEVTLVSHVVPQRDDLGAPHVVRVRTRKNGRFRADVRGGRGYSAWARLSAESGQMTDIVHETGPGRRCVLVAETRTRVARSVRILGLDAWKDRGPFRARLVTQSLHQLVVPVAIDTDPIEIPNLPGRRVSLEIVDRDGHGFWQQWVDVDRKRIKEGAKAGEDGRYELKVEIPPPLEIPVQVVHLETNEPVPGATVMFEAYRSSAPAPQIDYKISRVSVVPVGTTDAEGNATVRVPRTYRKNMSLGLVVRASGFVTAAANTRRWGGDATFSLEEREGKPPAVRLKMRPGFTVTGRVVDSKGEPIADLDLLTADSAALYISDNGASWRNFPDRRIRTDAQGRFRIDGALPTETLRLTAVPTPPQVSRMLPAIPKDATVPAKLHLWSQSPDRKWRGKREAGDIGGTLRWMRLTVRHDATLVRFANVVIQTRDKSGSSGITFDMRCDRRGSLLLALPPGKWSLAAWSDPAGYELKDFAISDEAEKTSFELTLKPFRWASGRTIDTDGKAVAEATLRQRGSGVSGRVPRMVRELNTRLSKRASDKEGYFRIPFVPITNYYYTIGAQRRNGGRYANGEHRIQGLEDIEGIEIVFPKLLPKKSKPDKKTEKKKSEKK